MQIRFILKLIKERGEKMDQQKALKEFNDFSLDYIKKNEGSDGYELHLGVWRCNRHKFHLISLLKFNEICLLYVLNLTYIGGSG